MEQKVYVLDTSVLLHDPDCIENFGDNIVRIPFWVLEELDKHKGGPNGRGTVARAVIRKLDHYRERGPIRAGVKTDCGGMLYVDHEGNLKQGPLKLTDTIDNRILAVAMYLNKSERSKEPSKRRPVILVTKDINLRVKADACGLNSQDYTFDQKNLRSLDDLYSGFAKIKIPWSHKGIFTALHRSETLEESMVWDITEKQNLAPNTCCHFMATSDGREEGKSVLAIYKAAVGLFRVVPWLKRNAAGGEKISPINYEQALAYALLIDPDISLVTLIGRAGTGKTLMALLAAWNQLDPPARFERVTIYRPMNEIGEKIGFLPGTIEEKYSPWKKPIIDNLRLILGSDNSSRAQGKGMQRIEDRIAEFEQGGVLEISPINYVRGRSLNKQFVMVDEAQNLTRLIVKTLITRAGIGTKVVLTGDVEQIDVPTLDPISNGLSQTIQRFHGQENYAHLTMRKVERSPLADLAAELL